MVELKKLPYGIFIQREILKIFENLCDIFSESSSI